MNQPITPCRRRSCHVRPHLRRLVVTMVAAAAAGALTAVGAIITVEAERRGEVIDVHATAWLSADVETAWRVLTDYGHYPQFIPDLHTSRVVARRGSRVTVEQAGDVRLWLMPVRIELTYDIVETAPRGLQSRAVARGLKDLTSSYVLSPERDGVRVDYEGRITPGFSWLGKLEQQAVRLNVARQFQALADEIDRKGRAAPGAEGDGARR